MVYIHGGGLMAGSGQWEPLDALASHSGPNGVVVVAMNYRLNAFGWLVLEELSKENGGTSGNYGLLDQQLALAWVRNNVAFFGGDAERVTVAGQSSGGISIFAHSPQEHPDHIHHRRAL
jgi:para-nitrobenzyl esterase